MITATIKVTGLNNEGNANKLLIWFQNAYERETKRALNWYDSRNWKVAKGWKLGDLQRKVKRNES